MKVKVSEKTIERQIIAWLWTKRILCTKIDMTGIWDAKRKAYRKQAHHFKRRGVSDIVGIYKGRFLSIEVKSEKGQLTSNQEEWLEDVLKHGGIAIVARSVDDVERALNLITDETSKPTDGRL